MCREIRITDRKERNQGMNWLSQERRLAIYLRDGLMCLYCGQNVAQVARLTLDHLIPHCKGGTNESKNLVTCCDVCNSSRGGMVGRDGKGTITWQNYIRAMWGTGDTSKGMILHISKVTRRKVYTVATRETIRQHGSCKKYLLSLMAS